MAQLDEGVVSAVINENFKTGAGLPSLVNNLAAINAQSHNKMLDSIREVAFGELVMQRAGLDVSEAVAAKKVSEADLGRSLGELGSAIAALQQIIKTAQSTPPPTP